MVTQDKIELFRALGKLPPDSLGNVFKCFNDKGIDAVCECVFNTIYTDLKIPRNKRNKIKHLLKQGSRKNIYTITNKRSNSTRKGKL